MQTNQGYFIDRRTLFALYGAHIIKYCAAFWRSHYVDINRGKAPWVRKHARRTRCLPLPLVVPKIVSLLWFLIVFLLTSAFWLLQKTFSRKLWNRNSPQNGGRTTPWQKEVLKRWAPFLSALNMMEIWRSETNGPILKLLLKDFKLSQFLSPKIKRSPVAALCRRSTENGVYPFFYV